jgi:hypothetical protein
MLKKRALHKPFCVARITLITNPEKTLQENTSID